MKSDWFIRWQMTEMFEFDKCPFRFPYNLTLTPDCFPPLADLGQGGGWNLAQCSACCFAISSSCCSNCFLSFKSCSFQPGDEGLGGDGWRGAREDDSKEESVSGRRAAGLLTGGLVTLGGATGAGVAFNTTFLVGRGLLGSIGFCCAEKLIRRVRNLTSWYSISSGTGTWGIVL